MMPIPVRPSVVALFLRVWSPPAAAGRIVFATDSRRRISYGCILQTCVWPATTTTTAPATANCSVRFSLSQCTSCTSFTKVFATNGLAAWETWEICGFGSVPLRCLVTSNGRTENGCCLVRVTLSCRVVKKGVKG
uniref:Putative secreted protein n=1 Tax=Anopheles marajoara TaxID=58244 RepID=A0A2M4C713_9DIPT